MNETRIIITLYHLSFISYYKINRRKYNPIDKIKFRDKLYSIIVCMHRKQPHKQTSSNI